MNRSHSIFFRFIGISVFFCLFIVDIAHAASAATSGAVERPIAQAENLSDVSMNQQKVSAVTPAKSSDIQREVDAGQGAEKQDTSSEQLSRNSFEHKAISIDKGEKLESATDKLLDVLVSLLAVIFLIFFLAAMFKRFGAGKTIGNDSRIIVKQMHPVGPKERLLVIEAYGKPMLLGITATSINHLCDFSPAEIENAELLASAQKSSEIVNIKNKLAGKIQRWYFDKRQPGHDPNFKKMLNRELREAKGKKSVVQQE